MKNIKLSGLAFGLFIASFFGNYSILSAQKIKKEITNQKTITKEYLTSNLTKNKAYYTKGKVADYIPELGKMQADKIAFSVVNADGRIISVGDINQKFTIQSISKIIALMVAVKENKLITIPLSEVENKLNLVSTNHPLVKMCRNMGVSFGDEY